MDIVVNPELQAYIDPLTPDEHAALERSLLAEGCRDALVLWGQVLVDGHNRYGICQKHGLPFRTVQNPRFQSIEDVQLWMIDQHLGRRSLSDYQRGVLALRKRDMLAERRAAAARAPSTAATPVTEQPVPAPADSDAAAQAAAPGPAGSVADALLTREALARAARLSSSQVQQIEKIQKQGAPELVQALKTGLVSLNAAAAVASLPAEAQAAAASAGADELKQAAKRVREAKRKTPPAAAAAEGIEALRARVAALEAENAALRQQLAALGVAP